MKLFEPNGRFISLWNKVFPLFSIISLFLDPLFFYIPVVDGLQQCVEVDQNLKIILCVLRSFVDVLYLLHIFVRLTSEHIVVADHHYARKAYLKSYYFFIDVLASLPLPQLVVLIIIPRSSFLMTYLLKIVVFVQFLPKVIVVSGFLTRKAWAHVALYLFVYVLASHVIGGLWYLFAIESQLSCWNIACERQKCEAKHLHCGEDGSMGDYWFLHISCPLLERTEIRDSRDFDFGIFIVALQNDILETRDLPYKLLYCLRWGLESLSGNGKDLKVGTSHVEILFVMCITAFGWYLRTAILVTYR